MCLSKSHKILVDVCCRWDTDLYESTMTDSILQMNFFKFFVLQAMPEEMVHDLLVQIATNIDKNGPDPILEDVDCHWHGEYSQGHPIIHLQKPGDPNPSPTYVNRIMALLFVSLYTYHLDIVFVQSFFKLDVIVQLSYLIAGLQPEILGVAAAVEGGLPNVLRAQDVHHLPAPVISELPTPNH